MIETLIFWQCCTKKRLTWFPDIIQLFVLTFWMPRTGLLNMPFAAISTKLTPLLPLTQIMSFFSNLETISCTGTSTIYSPKNRMLDYTKSLWDVLKITQCHPGYTRPTSEHRSHLRMWGREETQYKRDILTKKTTTGTDRSEIPWWIEARAIYFFVWSL